MGQPLFSPSSVFWRVNRELASGLAGPRAVLMQIAHPLIAAGVAEHSQFRTHRFARLYRTSMAAAAITFGSREFALRVIQSINKRHQQVHGVLRAQAGVFPAGTKYDANDPELKLWVLSTIIDSTLLVYDLFISPLSSDEREEYYRDNLIVAKLFAIPERILPSTYADFRSYMSSTLESDVISVSDTAREIARALFSPSIEGTLLFFRKRDWNWPASRPAAAGIRPPMEPPARNLVAPNGHVSKRMRGHVPTILCSSPMATLSHLRALSVR